MYCDFGEIFRAWLVIVVFVLLMLLSFRFGAFLLDFLNNWLLSFVRC